MMSHEVRKALLIACRNHSGGEIPCQSRFLEEQERHHQLVCHRESMRMLIRLSSSARTVDTDAMDKRERKGKPKYGY